MKKLIYIVVSLPLIGGCFPQNTPIIVAPGSAPLTQCREGNFLAPSTATLVSRSSVQDNVSQEVLVFDGSYRRNDLLRPSGEGWQLTVQPFCTISFAKRYAAVYDASIFPLGGLAVERYYTLLVISRDRWGVVEIDDRRFRTDDYFRPRRVRLGSTELVASEVVRLPTARARPLLDPSRIKLRLEIN